MNPTIENITPERAREYLATNVKNRPITKTYLNSLCVILRSGQWILTSDAIGFDTQGRLVNGQHRLTAIHVTGIPAQCYVVRGMPVESFVVTDRGRKRTANQILAIMGYKWSTQIAAGARVALAWVMEYTHTNHVDHQMIIAEVENNKDVYGHWGHIASRYKFTGVSSGAVVAFGVLGERMNCDSESLEEYIYGIATGENLGNGDVRLAVRTWYLNKKGHRHFGVTTLANLIRGYNRWIVGDSVTHMKSWKPGMNRPQFLVYEDE